ncbi:MAG: hypothetical protein ABI563_17035 [Specibacter sp.]
MSGSARSGRGRRVLEQNIATTAEGRAMFGMLYDGRHHTVQQIGDLLNVPRSTIYGYLNHTQNR